MLRNSLIPVVTAAGPILGFLITGSFVIEQIFAIPGIGRYYVTAVTARDYSVVMGLTVLLAIIVILANMVVDILYGVLDPTDAGRSDRPDGASTDRDAGAPGPAVRLPTRPGRQRRSRGAARRRATPALRKTRASGRTPGTATSATARAVVAGLIFILLLLYCIIWPIISPYDPNEVDFSHGARRRASSTRSAPTSSAATSSTRAALGGRVSIGIGFAATLVILFIGVTYGSISGFVGGRAGQRHDALARRALRAPVPAVRDHRRSRSSAPSTSGRWWSRCRSPRGSPTARIVRGQIITLKENDYVRAAKAVGARWHRILGRHLLPNTLGVLVIAIFLELPGVILGEAFLSFIGLGISPPDASWGSMAQDGRAYRVPPHIIIVPRIAIATLVLCANFIADGLRDALDPRTRET